MNNPILQDVREHLESVRNEINGLMIKNNQFLIGCGNEEEAEPYLSLHFDLISMRAANDAYIDLIPTPSSRKPIKEVKPLRLRRL